MALYLGNQKIASGGGSTISVETMLTTGTNIANIYVDDVKHQLFSPSASSGYAVLSGGNTISGHNIISSLVAMHDLPAAASLDSKSLIMTDDAGSYNVNYDVVKSSLETEVASQIEEQFSNIGNHNTLDYSAGIYIEKTKFLSTSACPYDCALMLYSGNQTAEAHISVDGLSVTDYAWTPMTEKSMYKLDIPAGVSFYAYTSASSTSKFFVIPYRYGKKYVDESTKQVSALNVLLNGNNALSDYFDGGIKWYGGFRAKSSTDYLSSFVVADSNEKYLQFMLYGKVKDDLSSGIAVKIDNPYSNPKNNYPKYKLANTDLSHNSTGDKSKTQASSFVNMPYKYGNTIIASKGQYLYIRLGFNDTPQSTTFRPYISMFAGNMYVSTLPFTISNK